MSRSCHSPAAATAGSWGAEAAPSLPAAFPGSVLAPCALPRTSPRTSWGEIWACQRGSCPPRSSALSHHEHPVLVGASRGGWGLVPSPPPGSRAPRRSQAANATGRWLCLASLFSPVPKAASAAETGCSQTREEIAKKMIE